MNVDFPHHLSNLVTQAGVVQKLPPKPSLQTLLNFQEESVPRLPNFFYYFFYKFSKSLKPVSNRRNRKSFFLSFWSIDRSSVLYRKEIKGDKKYLYLTFELLHNIWSLK